MLSIAIFFLLASVYLYSLLGGADFGAGVLELFSSKSKKEETRNLISKAMAPIWEANHMWLIITVVILFNAFPEIYTRISISLYIPLIIMLIGIIMRGTAFTFRYYDAMKDGSQEIYSKVFTASSLIVPFFLGSLLGAIISKKIMLHPNTFWQAYLAPWLNLFSISIGVFVVTIFAFVASVFLIGDSHDVATRDRFIRKSKRTTFIMVASGGLVFLSSYLEQNDFTQNFLSNFYSLSLIALATTTLPYLWSVLKKGKVWESRIIAGAQLLFIIAAFYAVYFPKVVLLGDGDALTLLNAAAPDKTVSALAWALLFVSAIIFPSLFYLFKVFKMSKTISVVKDH